MKGFGFRHKGRRGIAARTVIRPSKKQTPKAGKKVKQSFGGSNGTFGFR